MLKSKKSRSVRLWFTLVGGLLTLLLLPATALSSPARLRQADMPPGPRAQTEAPTGDEAFAEAQPAVEPSTHTIWLPLIVREPLSYRLGFGVAVGQISGYPQISSLKAGWYLDWNVKRQPIRPNAMEYVQTIRVHQKLTCPLYSANAHDRSLCPYVTPYDYVIDPSYEEISAALLANLGTLWLIGNEMDRRDWPNGGQDEILPQTYAVAYHDLYYFIKGVDPTAKVAIGGVIQATPLRLEYLTKVWDAYKQNYSTSTMPVDVWNVHNFILQERLNYHGASIPPGSTAVDGTVYLDAQHVDMAIFDGQIRAFRQWMKDRGQQEKPLIVSEYGVLYRHIEQTDTAEEVQAFMVQTFDYFLYNRDCTLGYQADDCRLVQRWAWFSLDDVGTWSGFNEFSALFDPSTKQITGTGDRYRTYSLTNLSRLAR